MRRNGKPSHTAMVDMSDGELDEILSESDFEEEDNSKKGVMDMATVLKGALTEPRFKTVSLRQLHDLVHMGGVNLDPVYQRGVVWTEPKMIKLIQSLFLNYYVPPVIFAIQQKPGTEDDERVCIDGKQRTTSIISFIEGKIPFKSPSTGDKFWYTKYGQGQKGGQILPANLRRKFDNIAIQVVEYDEIGIDKQRDIFQRVQLGVALTSAEKLHAMGSPWGDWCHELEKKYITGIDTLGSHLPNFDVKRSRHYQALVAFVVIAFDPPSRPVPTQAVCEKLLSRTDVPEKRFRRKVEMALGIFIDIAGSHYETAFSSVTQRVAPIEFWFIPFLIFSRMGSMSTRRLAREIAGMRSHVRARHVDIRGNRRVADDFYDYVDKTPRTKQPGDISAQEEYENADPSSRPRKRRRDDDDDDYHGEGPIGNPTAEPPQRQQELTKEEIMAQAATARPAIGMNAPVRSSYATTAYNTAQNGSKDAYPNYY